MTTLNEILTAAQSLPSSERAQLIAALWDNVSPTDWVPPDAQWIAEANRRSDAYDTAIFFCADFRFASSIEWFTTLLS